MKPIDGDNLKAILNDVEKTLKSTNKTDQEAWDIYVSVIEISFSVIRGVIDMMPELKTKEMNEE